MPGAAGVLAPSALIAGACVHSRFLYGAGTRGPLRPAAMRCLAVPFHRPLCRIALRGRFGVDDPDPVVTNPGILAMLHLLGLQFVLWAAKLRLWPRLLHAARPAPLVAVQSSRGANCRKDFTAAAAEAFLSHLLPATLSEPPDPALAFGFQQA